MTAAAMVASPARATPALTGAPKPAPDFSYVNGAGGVPLSVAQLGAADAPGILFIHGLGQSHLSFAFQFDAFSSARFHLVAFDLRGHGNSGKPWDEAAYAGSRTYADDVKAVIEASRLVRPLLVAWSYGTLVTADYIRHYGCDNLSGLVMIGALGGMASLPASAIDAKRAASLQEFHRLAASPGLENTLVASHQVVPLLTARPMSLEWTRTSETVNALLPPFARSAMSARMTTNNADLIERIHVPMLLAAGSEDRGTPDSLMRSLSARVVNSRYKVYPGSGHSPFAEDPERFNQDLLGFAGSVFAVA